MAQAGFPWQSQQQNAKKSDLPPHGLDLVHANLAPEKHLSDFTNRSHSTPGFLDEKQQVPRNGNMRAASLPATPSMRPSMRAPNEAQQRTWKESTRPAVRTVPPWVRSVEEDDLQPDPSNSGLPDTPTTAFVAQHNHSPSTSSHPLLHSKNHHQRDYYPTSSGQMRTYRTSRWVTFARTSAYPRETFEGEKVTTEWLDQNFGDYSQKWLANRPEGDVEDGTGRYHAFQKKRQVWYKRSQSTIMRNPFIPLVFRLIVFFFSLIALALGTTIIEKSTPISAERRIEYHPGPSALMAVIVDAIALVYLAYITYDEYFSKPLGLRPARAKVRLILLDLFFIVFQSANLSLAFDSMSIPDGACKAGNTERTDFLFPDICRRAESLAAMLLVALIAWLLTFSVSVLRLVERMG